MQPAQRGKTFPSEIGLAAGDFSKEKLPFAGEIATVRAVCSFMATLQPFRALRPDPRRAARICELPYDVMSTREARALAAGNPDSFLHVSKPEIDLPDDLDPYDPAVYRAGAERFARMIRDGLLRQETEACYYLYRQVMGAHAQTGLVAAASCADYLSNVIKKHELTRPDKEDDRVRHIEALHAQTGPVFLTYRATRGFDEFIQHKTQEPPDIDFTAPDGVRHASWTVRDPGQINLITQTFAGIPGLYIADGHHRSAAAARVFQARQGAGGSGAFLAVIFPHDQLQILPYNRVLKDLAGLNARSLLDRLSAVFDVRIPGEAAPARKHELGLFLEGRWISLRFKDALVAGGNPIDLLDATLLQRQVLGPVFHIDDPRTSKRINFVGGIRGTAELEGLVRSGEYACAFSMFPTGIDDLMAISDAGGIMPPKSTWFEPKLRDGLFCHLI